MTVLHLVVGVAAVALIGWVNWYFLVAGKGHRRKQGQEHEHH
jgi:hypothetical protein